MAQKPPKLLGLVAIVLLATAGTGAVVLLSKKSDTVQSAANPASTASPATPAVSSNADQPVAASSAASTHTTTSSTYKNGTYTATGNYDTPDSYETIGVTLTVQNDVVTAVSIQNSGQRESAEYQARFANSYKQYVVGKAISSISLSRVSGSSLTSTGFNNALQAIESQAKA